MSDKYTIQMMETTIIGSVITYPKTQVFLRFLSIDLFISEMGKFVFSQIIKLYQEGTAITYESLKLKCGEAGRFDSAINNYLKDCVVSAFPIDKKFIIDFIKQSKLYKSKLKLSRLSEKDINYNDFVENLDEIFSDISLIDIDNISEFYPGEFKDKRIAIFKRRESLDKVIFGIPPLDEMVPSGLMPKEISIIASRPSIGKCIAEDTLIQTSSGMKFISDVKENDKVMSCNFKQGNIEFKRVEDVIYQGKMPVYKIVIDDLFFIRSTIDHKFFSREGWVPVSNLDVGSKILFYNPYSRSFSWVKIKKIIPDGISEVYDLTIEDLHNYIVNGFVVHNSSLKANLITRQCNLGYNVVNIATEQTEEVETDRIDSILTGIPLTELLNSRNWADNDERIKKVIKANEYIDENWNYFLLVNRKFSTTDVYRYLKKLVNKYGKIDVVYIDLFDKLVDVNVSSNKPLVISQKLGYLNQVAEELNLHICLLVQINRELRNVKGHRPRIWHLKDSGSYEEVARLVLLLHRESYYNRQIRNNVLEVNIAKQNNGPAGEGVIVKFDMDRETMILTTDTFSPRIF